MGNGYLTYFKKAMTTVDIISSIVTILLAGIFAQPLGRKLVDWQKKREEQRKQRKQNKNQEQDAHNGK